MVQRNQYVMQLLRVDKVKWLLNHLRQMHPAQ